MSPAGERPRSPSAPARPRSHSPPASTGREPPQTADRSPPSLAEDRRCPQWRSAALRAAPASSASRCAPRHRRATGQTAAAQPRTGDHQHTSVACPGRGKQSINRAITGRPGAAVISPRQSHHLSGIDRTFGRGLSSARGRRRGDGRLRRDWCTRHGDPRRARRRRTGRGGVHQVGSPASQDADNRVGVPAPGAGASGGGWPGHRKLLARQGGR